MLKKVHIVCIFSKAENRYRKLHKSLHVCIFKIAEGFLVKLFDFNPCLITFIFAILVIKA